MTSTAHHDERIAGMSFAKVYPLLVAKVERKGRTEAELQQVIEWLTGFDAKTLKKVLAGNPTFAEFFQRAKVNRNAKLITGTICGYRVEEITNPLTQKVRWLDKLVDELAKGRAMDRILRSPETPGTATAAKNGAAVKRANTAGNAKTPKNEAAARKVKAPKTAATLKNARTAKGVKPPQMPKTSSNRVTAQTAKKAKA
ncbi:MAG: DUF2200 domain-containing protein [Gammaproteobacteria bacterium]